MKQVSIVGSGNVGANSAFFIIENHTASVLLVDIKQGLSTGKALDISEAGPIRQYDTKLRSSNDIQAIRNSDIVVISAGRVRHPNESREDLYRDNGPLVESICAKIRELAPSAVVINVVEPVDMTTLLAQNILGFDRKRVLGVGGLLSSTRLRYLVSKALGVSPREVTGMVIGPHHTDMVVLRNTVRVSGIPADKLLSGRQIESIVEEVRRADETMLFMAQQATAFYAPSAAIATLVEAIVRDTKAILPAVIRLEGEHGLRGIAISVPARICAQGIERVIDVEMSADEEKEFRAATAALRSSLDHALGMAGTMGGAKNA
jgi:malate dehydrogenase